MNDGVRSDGVFGEASLSVAVLAGIAVFASGVRPTGNSVVDAIETVVAVALVCALGARAPWWMVVGAAGVAGAMGLGLVPVVLAGLAFAIAAWVSPLPEGMRARRDLGTLSLGLTMTAFAFGKFDGTFGVSAVVAIGVSCALVVAGLLDCPRRYQRSAGKLLLGVAVFVVLAAAMLGLAARSARSELRSAVDQTRSAVDLVRDLDASGASARLLTAADGFSSGADELGAWWTTPGRLVPILAQHRRAGVELSSELANQLEAASRDLGELPLDDLRIIDGAIDIDAVRALDQPLERFDSRLDRLGRTVDEVDSPWLHSSVRDKVFELRDELADVRPVLGEVDAAIDVLPAMLGESAQRRYLLLFTTPSEARGLGGFIGNYAVLTVDGGRLAITESGRRTALELAADRAGVVLTRPDQMLATYGKFGLVGSDGTVGPRSWSNLTMEPDWPSFATAALDLFDGAAPNSVDGVFVLDPHVLGQLTRYTGPVPLGDGRTAAGDDMVDYLLLGQYDRPDRLEALEQLSSVIIDAFLQADLPRPIDLVRDLQPLVDEQRLLGWSALTSEQEVLTSAGLGLGLPDITEADGFSLALTNAGASKIDAFLQRSVELEHVATPAGTIVRARVTLVNGAPAEGYQPYVIGNEIGLPSGTSRLYLSAYSSALMETVTVDGEPVGVERGLDVGWDVAAHTITLGPGDRVEIVYEFEADHPNAAILERRQPLAERG